MKENHMDLWIIAGVVFTALGVCVSWYFAYQSRKQAKTAQKNADKANRYRQKAVYAQLGIKKAIEWHAEQTRPIPRTNTENLLNQK